MTTKDSPKGIGRWLVAVFLTLRGRLILLVCMTTVPAIGFIFFAAVRERQAALERMDTEARHLGSLASREHAHQLNGARNLLRRLGKGVACDREVSVPRGCPDHLPALLEGLPQFANIGVAQPGGEVVCSAASIRYPANLGDNSAFQRALGSDDVEAGNYVVGFIGRPVLHLAYAVHGPGERPCAVLFVAVELRWLEALARQANLPADYSLLISDRTGRVLAHSGDGTVGEQAGERPIPALAAALGRTQGTLLEIGAPPTSRYFVSTPMEGVPGVYVLAGLPHERVERAANQAFYRTLLALVLVTLFAIAAAIFAAEISVLRVLRALTRSARKLEEGDLSARPPLPGTHGELRELALSFGAMADALETRQREAIEARDRLRALSHRLQVAREEEAGRIARELHDELGQILTGLKIELSTVRRACSGAAPADRTDQAISRMGEQIDSAIDSVRRISSELRPAVLDRLGLLPAIEWLVQNFEAKAQLAIVLDAQDLTEPLDPKISTAVFRILQEALTNVVRHADATQVEIDLSQKGGSLRLTVRDNGKGIEPAAVESRSSLGILGMKERVSLLGGSWQIRGEPRRGTTISVQVPVQTPPAKGGD